MKTLFRFTIRKWMAFCFIVLLMCLWFKNPYYIRKPYGGMFTHGFGCRMAAKEWTGIRDMIFYCGPNGVVLVVGTGNINSVPYGIGFCKELGGTTRHWHVRIQTKEKPYVIVWPDG